VRRTNKTIKTSSYKGPIKYGNTADCITAVCDSIKQMLLEKNKAYGDSAIDPVRIFSKSPVEEQIKVRIDDKLSRIARGNEFPGEDTIDDLIGYLILLKIAKLKQQ